MVVNTCASEQLVFLCRTWGSWEYISQLFPGKLNHSVWRRWPDDQWIKQSITAFVTPKAIALSRWEGLLRKGLWDFGDHLQPHLVWAEQFGSVGCLHLLCLTVSWAKSLWIFGWLDDENKVGCPLETSASSGSIFIISHFWYFGHLPHQPAKRLSVFCVKGLQFRLSELHSQCAFAFLCPQGCHDFSTYLIWKLFLLKL